MSQNGEFIVFSTTKDLIAHFSHITNLYGNYRPFSSSFDGDQTDFCHQFRRPGKDDQWACQVCGISWPNLLIRETKVIRRAREIF